MLSISKYNIVIQSSPIKNLKQKPQMGIKKQAKKYKKPPYLPNFSQNTFPNDHLNCTQKS